jgi:hypothetical protein
MKRKNWWNVVGECAVCFFFFFTPPPPPYSSSSSSTAIVGNIWMNLKLAGVVLVTCSRFQQPTTPSSSSQQSSRRRRPVGLILHRVNRRRRPRWLCVIRTRGVRFCLWPCISDISCRRELDYIPRIIFISSSDQRSTDCRSLTNESPASWVFEFYLLDCR